MDNKFRNLVEATRNMEITDLYGHELEAKPILCISRHADPSYFRHAREAGLATQYLEEDPATYAATLGAISGAAAGHERGKISRRGFLGAAGKAGLGALVGYHLSGISNAQSPPAAPAAVKIGSGNALNIGGVENYPIRIPMASTESRSITERVQMIPKFHDPEVFVPQTNDYLDGLAHLYYMNGAAYRKQACGAAQTYRWESLPINYFIENEASAPAGYVDATLQAAEAWNSNGLTFFRKVNFDPTQGNNVGVKIWYRAGPTGTGIINEIICKGPTQADIAIKNAFPNDPLNKIIITHEEGHAIMFGTGAGTVHSLYSQHNMRNGPSKMPNVFEKKEVEVLYRLRNGTNLEIYVFDRAA